MSTPQHLVQLADIYKSRTDMPAVIAVQTDLSQIVWSYTELAQSIDELSTGLIEQGVAHGERIVVWGPNSPVWICVYFAILKCGATAVPLDDLMGLADLSAIFQDNGCQRMFTVAKHINHLVELHTSPMQHIWLMDEGELPDAPIKFYPWRSILSSASVVWPQISPDNIASLVYTSGTTGVPKGVPLTHGNLMANLAALADHRLIEPKQRVLLPLPLHHIYPFTCGMLLTLSLGGTLIFPAGISGPQLVGALKSTDVQAMLGVPRLYTALLAGIKAKIKGRRALAKLFPVLLKFNQLLRKSINLNLGRILFKPIHSEIAPQLQLLACGGAHLDVETAEELYALGWDVLTGYGLSETSPVLTFNPRQKAHLDTEGQPLVGVSLRIASDTGNTYGEIQATGPSVFQGYWYKPEETKMVFTDDGWFKTGDLGYLDAENYLHIVGRLKEMIAMPDGKNIFPEALEGRYIDSQMIKEVAILEDNGLLVGIFVPDTEAVRERGLARLEGLIREEIDAVAYTLPSYQRLSGFVISRDALPRTNLGKLRRHLLPTVYRSVRSGQTETHKEVELTVEDQALLAQPFANQLLQWLITRYPDKKVRLDASPQLDLGIDSLEWVSITLELQQNQGITMNSGALGRIETVRDFLKEAIDAQQSAQSNPTVISDKPVQDLTWIAPLSPWHRALGYGIHLLNQLLMKLVYRLEVSGLENIAPGQNYIFAPNHTSFLDPFVVAAALDWRQLAKTYWAGWVGILFVNPLTRLFSRVTRVFPVDLDFAPAETLAYGNAVLKRGDNLVIFPEGRRSLHGDLLPFRSGISLFVKENDVAVVPVLIIGAWQAWHPQKRLPRLGKLRVKFGPPINNNELKDLFEKTGSLETVAERVHDAVKGLAE